MKAEIIAVGTELLLGHIVDTNSAYLAQELAGLGIDLFYISHVGDNQGRVVETIAQAWRRSDLIVMTGGLGPTEDDLTREAIAQFLGEEMAPVPELVEQVRSFFAQRGREMPLSNLKQATLIPSARALGNPFGTAPGWWVEREGRVLVAMPGVPREMKSMWGERVVPLLRRHQPEQVIHTRTLKVVGLGESSVEERIKSLLASTNPTVATYAKEDGIHVRLSAKAGDREAARSMLAGLEAEVRSLLGHHIYGADEESLPQVVGKLLLERKLTLASMESCTGGLFASTITDAPGSSAYFRGGLVAYGAQAKVAWGVDAALVRAEGTVSPGVAEAMAGRARSLLGADVGVGITGVAGPEAIEGKPVGTVHIAVALARGCRRSSMHFPSTRSEVKRLAVLTALAKLREALFQA